MSRDRTRTRDRSGGGDGEFDAEFEIGDDGPPESTATKTETDSGDLRDRMSTRAGRLFSPRQFLLALLLTVGGLFAANTLVPLPGAGLLGVFAATFLFGLAVKERRYVETALAGGIVAGLSTLLDFVVVAFLGGFGVSLAVLAGGLGVVAGGLGTYFGRDLRDGLMRDL